MSRHGGARPRAGRLPAEPAAFIQATLARLEAAVQAAERRREQRGVCLSAAEVAALQARLQALGEALEGLRAAAEWDGKEIL